MLRPGGRLAVVSLQLTQPSAAMARLYLAARRHLPRLPDCRLIPVPDLLGAVGWQLRALQPLSLSGLPAAAALATPVPVARRVQLARRRNGEATAWPGGPDTP